MLFPASARLQRVLIAIKIEEQSRIEDLCLLGLVFYTMLFPFNFVKTIRMKDLLIPVLICLFSISGFAQDLLITKDADTLFCEILSVDSDFLHFKVESRDKSSQVPITALYKYRQGDYWTYVGELNPTVYESKIDLTVQKEGTIKQSGFYLRKGGNQLMIGGILTLSGFSIAGIGGAVATRSPNAGLALIGVGGAASLAGLIYMVSAGMNISKAGNELEFIPVKQ